MRVAVAVAVVSAVGVWSSVSVAGNITWYHQTYAASQCQTWGQTDIAPFSGSLMNWGANSHLVDCPITFDAYMGEVDALMVNISNYWQNGGVDTTNYVSCTLITRDPASGSVWYTSPDVERYNTGYNQYHWKTSALNKGFYVDTEAVECNLQNGGEILSYSMYLPLGWDSNEVSPP